MRGSIAKRKSGNYQARWHTGEGRYKSKTLRTKKEAEKFLSRIVDESHQGTYRELKPVNFEAFSKLWLEVHGPNLRPSTYDLYEMFIRKHFLPVFGKSPLTSVGIDDIQKFLAIKRKDLSPASVSRMRQVLVKVFDHAKKWHYVRDNPAGETEAPKIPHKEMQFLTPKEAERLLTWLERNDPSYFPIFQTAIQTGLRLGELLGLKWQDISFKEGIIRVKRQITKGKVSEPKSKRSIRQVPLPQSLSKTLKEHRLASMTSLSGWVFTSEAGTPLNERNLIRRRFLPALKASGVKRIRFHDLRHTYAAHLVAAGTHSKAIQEALGHTSIKTTLDKYGHLMPSAFSEIAQAIDRLYKKG